MQRRAITVPLLVAAIGVAGCGSSSNSAKTNTAGTSAANGGNVPGRSYTVKLSGSAEVPKGAPGAGGTATISISGVKQQLCWKFRLTGVTSPAVAHVHTGAAGTAGPVLIPLGAKYKKSGCASAVSKSELAQIVAAPKKYYVNIHNAKFPGGAVRAQL